MEFADLFCRKWIRFPKVSFVARKKAGRKSQGTRADSILMKPFDCRWIFPSHLIHVNCRWWKTENKPIISWLTVFALTITAEATTTTTTIAYQVEVGQQGNELTGKVRNWATTKLELNASNLFVWKMNFKFAHYARNEHRWNQQSTTEINRFDSRVFAHEHLISLIEKVFHLTEFGSNCLFICDGEHCGRTCLVELELTKSNSSAHIRPVDYSSFVIMKSNRSNWFMLNGKAFE